MTAEQKRVAKEKRDREKNENPFETPKEKRSYVKSGVVTDPGVPCFHCGHRYGHKKSHKLGNGRQRYICGNPATRPDRNMGVEREKKVCGKPFVAKKIG